ncbi:hypothetical protein NC652_027635 [Populus alba x Populus x berolinensis]|nr:hypothetical protein NC652_027635 [Populus alba x Populus x berolinensis]
MDYKVFITTLQILFLSLFFFFFFLILEEEPHRSPLPKVGSQNFQPCSEILCSIEVARQRSLLCSMNSGDVMWTTRTTKEKGGKKKKKPRIIGHFAHGVNKYNPHHI